LKDDIVGRGILDGLEHARASLVCVEKFRVTKPAAEANIRQVYEKPAPPLRGDDLEAEIGLVFQIQTDLAQQYKVATVVPRGQDHEGFPRGSAGPKILRIHTVRYHMDPGRVHAGVEEKRLLRAAHKNDRVEATQPPGETNGIGQSIIANV